MKIHIIILLLFVCMFSFAGQNEIPILFQQIESITQEASGTAMKCKTTQELTAVLKRSDTMCKNLIKISSAPAGFKKKLMSLVDQHKFVVALVIIRTHQNRVLTDDETKQVQAYANLYAECEEIAEKHGYKHDNESNRRLQ